MSVDIMIEDERWEKAGLPALADTATRAALAHLGLDATNHEISFLACGDARIAALNADFRGKPMPTNVLSWPSQDRAAQGDGQPPAPPTDTELGDIAISFDTCLRESAEQGKPFGDHVSHLIVHGVLHLLGYDHLHDRDATLMEGLEVAILGKLGLPDPYRNETGA